MKPNPRRFIPNAFCLIPLFLGAGPLWADTLSDHFPVKPHPVAELMEEVIPTPDPATWKNVERFYKDPEGQKILHTVQARYLYEGTPEQPPKSYTVALECYYDGHPGAHGMTMSYQNGQLRRITYTLGKDAAMVREFDAFGAEIIPPLSARGARHKRQNILNMFQEVYGSQLPGGSP